MRGGPGERKAVLPPKLRVVFDKESGNLRSVEFFPWFSESTVSQNESIGWYPSEKALQLTFQAMNRKYESLDAITDRLLDRFKGSKLVESQAFAEWHELFMELIEEGLLPFCGIPGFPLSAEVIDPTLKRSQVDTMTASSSIATSALMSTREPTEADLISILEVADEVRNLIHANDLPPSLSAEWIQISNSLKKQGFSIAVVGEFSRGKSTLINALISESLLPVGDLPTTAHLTRLVYGPKYNAISITAHGDRLLLEIRRDDQPGLVIPESLALDAVIQVSVPSDWLSDADVQLYDTPGLGDLVDKNTNIVNEAIATCDATIIAVSALSPLSLTEQDFVKSHVFHKHVPKIAVVVTRLDQIAVAERKQVIEYIVDKTLAWAPQIEVWIAGEVSVECSRVRAIGCGSIRQRITQWAREPNRIADKILRAGRQLRDLVSLVQGGLDTQRTTHLEGALANSRAIEAAVRGIKAKQLDWDNVSIAADKLSMATTIAIDEFLRLGVSDLKQRLTIDLERAPRPHEWWSNELPYRINTELRSLTSKLNQLVNQRLSKDFDWLNSQLKEHFAEVLKVVREDAVLKLEPPQIQSFSPADLTTLQTRGRIISGLVAAGGFVLLGPFGGAASLLGGLLTDRIFQARVSEQRQQLKAHLETGLERMELMAVQTSKDWCRKAYQTIVEYLENQSKIWVDMHTAAIQTPVVQPVELDRGLEKARQLSKRLTKIVGEE
jgi:GTP-binding protein EngB required for normal cell division